MANPIICEVTRGGLVESMHRGAYVVVDAKGRIVSHAGDIERPVYARSSMKVMQALPLIESGAADALGFGVKALSLAAASHSGEPGHAALAAEMLQRAGLGEADLGCGPQWPDRIKDAVAVAATRGGPARIHNNCSGKHAGFLATAAHTKADVASYLDPDNPVQAGVKAAVEAVAGIAIDGGRCSIDGCSAPTFAMPLTHLATGFARMATGAGLSADRAAAARRLLDAAMAEPWYVAGTGRMCTEIMRLAPGRIYAKTGAEGVYVAAFPEAGLALALKCDDGTTRAAEALLAALVLKHGGLGAEADAALARLTERPVTDRNGALVGHIRGYAPT